MEDETLDFGDSITDSVLVSKANELNELLQNIDDHISFGEHYRQNANSLPIEERIDYNLFALFAINSLYWIKLKLQGVDPNTHPVKNHIQKVKSLMQKKQQITDKKLRPKLDQKAAQRFIRSGLWEPTKPGEQPLNKKIKFNN